jgi:hypothetical protein
MNARFRLKGAVYGLNSEGDLEVIEVKQAGALPASRASTFQERMAILDWVLSLPSGRCAIEETCDASRQG